MTSFWDSNILAAFVGGLIGFFSSLVTSIWYTNRQKKILRYQGYYSWCSGVLAEIRHLLKVVDEIKDILDRRGVPSTKRLNHDYLEQARIKVIDFEDDLILLESLTNAYRDIVHTNDMLDRLERDFETKPSFLSNVVSSMVGVKNSLVALQANVVKSKDALKKPRFYKSPTNE